ncbi:Os07g0516100 [Oryza sativa Japonica Group]|uniref:Os07g0516100 protein n=1 Tax=Oryza sativa subsp. japonica TaxID=39947 RepID=A0A0P0X6R4_ORYSJ|nr:Os07g0516100 [Oryza sativa Japonica Group]
MASSQQAVRETGRGRASSSSAGGRKVTFGYHLVEGKTPHGMEDLHVAEFRRLDDGNEVGRPLRRVRRPLRRRDVATYLRERLFDDILREPGFWTDTAPTGRCWSGRRRRRVDGGDGHPDQRRDAGGGERGGLPRRGVRRPRGAGAAAIRGPRAAPGARRHRALRRVRDGDPRRRAARRRAAGDVARVRRPADQGAHQLRPERDHRGRRRATPAMVARSSSSSPATGCGR